MYAPPMSDGALPDCQLNANDCCIRAVIAATFTKEKPACSSAVHVAVTRATALLMS